MICDDLWWFVMICDDLMIIKDGWPHSNFEDKDNSDEDNKDNEDKDNSDEDGDNECEQVMGRCEGGRPGSDNGSRRLCTGRIPDVNCTGTEVG